MSPPLSTPPSFAGVAPGQLRPQHHPTVGPLRHRRRTTRHPGDVASQRIRKRIEEAFGWMKSVGGMRRPMLRGTDRVGWAFTFAAAAYNLVRLPKLIETAA